MKQHHLPSGSKPAGRRSAGRAQDYEIHDTYKLRGKLSEPSVCQQCGAVYHDGHWQWLDRPEGAEELLCQACQRINDDYPAGVVTLGGKLPAERQAELERLIRNQEAAEKGQHPLNRIIDIEHGEDATVVRTTDIHLPRRIGEAVKRAFKGKLELKYDKANYFVRVDWRAP